MRKEAGSRFPAQREISNLTGNFLHYRNQKIFRGVNILSRDLILLQQSIETGLRETRNAACLFNVSFRKCDQVI